MIRLALANVAHRKVRSLLAALAVAIGIAMMITMMSLTQGMVRENSDRFQRVPAELFVFPRQENAIVTAGVYFSPKYAPLIASAQVDGRPIVEHVIPVVVHRAYMGGQTQSVYALYRDDLARMIGPEGLVAGRLFSTALSERIEHLRDDQGNYDPSAITPQQLAEGCELVIDTLLARVGKYKVGDEVALLGQTFRIVGIVRSGVLGRVFAPIETVRHIQQGGSQWSSLFFVKLTDPALIEPAIVALGDLTQARVQCISAYGALLRETFDQVYWFMRITSGIALVVCFLFVLLTVYTLVLERTREIGILRSLGASRRFVLSAAVCEALVISLIGTAAGIGLAFVAAWCIEGWRPLLTVTIEWRWLALAGVVGVIGGALSALYPGYRAARLDPAMALSFE
jgi:putative ABC transport system permease protein